MPALEILSWFPAIRGAGFRITSPQTPSYNCIAWAACDAIRWWWPDDMGIYYWPPKAPRECNLPAFISAYRTIGFEPCKTGKLETGYEKIVIYAMPDGTPTHAARQLPSGAWTSKLGGAEDIEHGSEDGIAGTHYGSPKQYMKRRLKSDKK